MREGILAFPNLLRYQLLYISKVKRTCVYLILRRSCLFVITIARQHYGGDDTSNRLVLLECHIKDKGRGHVRHIQDAPFLLKSLLENLTETRASTVAVGTKRTSGMALIAFSWGTFSPALLATMAAGGVTIPAISTMSSTLLRLTVSFIKLMSTLFFPSLSFVSSQILKHFCVL
jgi:hypothetical protein